MNKKTILILIALNSNQLFCAKAETPPKEMITGLCAAAQSAERFSYKVQPSNQVTEKEADEHEALMDAAFKRDTTEKEYRKKHNIHLPVPDTFVYQLNQKVDVIVSAYETKEGKQEQVLVGGLFGTKHRDPEEDPIFGFIGVVMHINAIYVADGFRRQNIGSHMVELFQDYTKNLPIALYVKTTNKTGRQFWDTQANFQQLTRENASACCEFFKKTCTTIPIKQKDLVTYYSENGSRELIDNGKSIFDVSEF
jgi:ribosomal protein S18 acetylase RimI-like enzyme